MVFVSKYINRCNFNCIELDTTSDAFQNVLLPVRKIPKIYFATGSQNSTLELSK